MFVNPSEDVHLKYKKYEAEASESGSDFQKTKLLDRYLREKLRVWSEEVKWKCLKPFSFQSFENRGNSIRSERPKTEKRVFLSDEVPPGAEWLYW